MAMGTKCRKFDCENDGGGRGGGVGEGGDLKVPILDGPIHESSLYKHRVDFRILIRALAPALALLTNAIAWRSTGKWPSAKALPLINIKMNKKVKKNRFQRVIFFTKDSNPVQTVHQHLSSHFKHFISFDSHKHSHSLNHPHNSSSSSKFPSYRFPFTQN